MTAAPSALRTASTCSGIDPGHAGNFTPATGATATSFTTGYTGSLNAHGRCYPR